MKPAELGESFDELDEDARGFLLEVPPPPPLARHEGRCQICDRVFDRRYIDAKGAARLERSRTKCRQHRWARRLGEVDRCTPFDLDKAAQKFVEEHPDGATLDEVGHAMGLTRERIRQIEAVAIAKILGL